MNRTNEINHNCNTEKFPDHATSRVTAKSFSLYDQLISLEPEILIKQYDCTISFATMTLFNYDSNDIMDSREVVKLSKPLTS